MQGDVIASAGLDELELRSRAVSCFLPSPSLDFYYSSSQLLLRFLQHTSLLSNLPSQHVRGACYAPTRAGNPAPLTRPTAQEQDTFFIEIDTIQEHGIR